MIAIPLEILPNGCREVLLVGEAKDGKITFNKVLKLAEIHFQVIFNKLVIFNFNPTRRFIGSSNRSSVSRAMHSASECISRNS